MRSPSEKFRDSITKDNLWLYLLTLLKEKDRYPYQIREKVRERFHFTPGNMTAYIVLKRLQNEQYIRKTGQAQGGGPKRTYYSISAKGEKELEKAKAIYQELGKAFRNKSGGNK